MHARSLVPGLLLFACMCHVSVFCFSTYESVEIGQSSLFSLYQSKINVGGISCFILFCLYYIVPCIPKHIIGVLSKVK